MTVAPLLGQILAQVIIGTVAAIPFMRRRSVYTALFTLTFWLAGLATVIAQPMRRTNGLVNPVLSGSLWALLLSNIILVAWGTCASLLYIIHTHRVPPSEHNPTTTIRRSHTASLRQKVTTLILGQTLVLLALIGLSPWASTNALVRQQGIWFPVTPGMPPSALAYTIVGRAYVLGMFSWAIYGLQRVARHFLRHPIMRLGAWLGCCVACGMLVQSVIVEVAQAQGLNYYATPAGQATLSLWLALGFVFPMGALTVVGTVNRWRLFWLARDLRAFSSYLIATLACKQPHRSQEVNDWIEQLFGTDADLVLTAPVHPRGITSRLKMLARDVWETLQTPTGGVDTLVAFVRDVIEAIYPQPGEAMLLAAIWLWRQPPSVVRQFSERDVAALLLAATLVGGEEGLFAPLQMSAPEPLQHAFMAGDWRDWRQWGTPVGANFLRGVWHLLANSSHAGFTPEVRQGVQALRSLLPFLSPEDRAELIDRWIGTLEQLAEESAASSQDNEGIADDTFSPSRVLPPDPFAQWWRPFDLHPSQV